MATKIETTKTPEATPVVKAEKIKKPPVLMVTRITDQMKRAALQGKLSTQELDTLANLAGALKTFVSAS